MDALYRITAGEGSGCVCYAKNQEGADAVAAAMYGNGFRAHIQRLKKTEVPLGEIHIVNHL